MSATQPATGTIDYSFMPLGFLTTTSPFVPCSRTTPGAHGSPKLGFRSAKIGTVSFLPHPVLDANSQAILVGRFVTASLSFLSHTLVTLSVPAPLI